MQNSDIINQTTWPASVYMYGCIAVCDANSLTIAEWDDS